MMQPLISFVLDYISLRVLNMLGMMRKRKFQGEQLELPIPKHKCWERPTVSDEWLRLKGETKGVVIDQGDDNVSKPESMKDSNSYAEDSDSSTSILSEAKYAETTIDQSNSFSHSSSTSDDSTEELATQGFLDLQEKLLEFGSHAEYEDEKGLEECTDKELQGFLCANGLNSNVYVLSSGRWSVNEEVRSGVRSPTIDQEFEQYFSMLML